MKITNKNVNAKDDSQSENFSSEFDNFYFIEFPGVKIIQLSYQ